MDSDTTGIVPEKGMTVVGSDGMRVGTIDLVESTYVIVRAGALFPQDHFIPIADIVAQDADGALRLSLPADEALERSLGNPMGGADTRPESITEATTDVRRLPGAEDLPTDQEEAVVTEPDISEPRDEPPLTTDQEPDRLPETGVPESRDDDMHRTVPVVEETLDVHVRPVERGTVRVQKHIIEERQTIEVPLVEEEVEVTRRRVDREIRDDDHAFEEHSIEIPLHGQTVEIEKRAQVVEEIAIDKTARTRTEHVTDTVRKESARVEGDAVEDPGPAGVNEDDSEVR